MEKDALIIAYLLDGNGGGKQLHWDEIKKWQPNDGPLWVHLNFTKQLTKKWLRQESHIPSLVANTMSADDVRPRANQYQDGLFVSLRGVNYNPGADPEDMVSIRIWLEANRIVTTRRLRLLSIDDLVQSIEQGVGPKNATEILLMINERLTDRMADVIENINDQADDLEQEVIQLKSHELRPVIAEVRRQAISIKRYLGPQREALSRLFSDESILLTNNDRLRIRETTDRVIRYLEDLDSARERAAITQEELASRIAEQMDKRMYLLSMVALIFLPLTFITGLLGINVGGIPGNNNPHGFYIVLVLSAVIFAIELLLFRRKKWF